MIFIFHSANEWFEWLARVRLRRSSVIQLILSCSESSTNAALCKYGWARWKSKKLINARFDCPISLFPPAHLTRLPSSTSQFPVFLSSLVRFLWLELFYQANCRKPFARKTRHFSLLAQPMQSTNLILCVLVVRSSLAFRRCDASWMLWRENECSLEWAVNKRPKVVA